MKTQHSGRSSRFTDAPLCFIGMDCCSLSAIASIVMLVESLKNYRENRENGMPIDSPKRSFPMLGFDELCIESANYGDRGWPDSSGRYWWELTLTNGKIVNDFYWMIDNVRGWSEDLGKERCWLTVYHIHGTKMEGFSYEPDYEKGFPDQDRRYWCYIQFADTYSSAVAQWMEEKDRNYQIRRLSFFLKILYQPPSARDGFNLFTGLPANLQLMILEFVEGKKLVTHTFEQAINSIEEHQQVTMPPPIRK